MKNKIIFLILLFMSLKSIVFATNDMDVSGFIDSVKEYSNEIFPEISDENWINDILKGDMEISAETIIKRLLNIFFESFKENIGLLYKILAIAFLCAILKNIQSSFGGRCK